MWSGLWGTTIEEAWSLLLLLHCVSHSDLSPYIYLLGVLIKDTDPSRPRSCYLLSCTRIFHLSHSYPSLLRCTPVVGSLVPESKHNIAYVLLFTCNSLFTCAHLLGTSILLQVRNQGASTSTWLFILVQCGVAGNVDVLAKSGAH